MAIMDRQATHTPPSAGSPKAVTHLRERSTGNAPVNRRYSRHIDPSSLDSIYGVSSGRPASPLADLDARSRSHRYGNASPKEIARREQQPTYFSNPNSAKTPSSWRPETPAEGPLSSKTTSSRSNHSADSTISQLPANKPIVRVIHNGGQTKVVDIKECKTGDQIILATLRKLGLPENQVKNHCFYTADEFCQEPDFSRRLTESELSRICNDSTRPERGRLILRKIHAGEPTFEEVERARSINQDEINQSHKIAIATNNSRNMAKVQKLTGEPLSTMQYPLSPATFEAPSSSLRMDHRARPAPKMNPVPEFSPPKRTDSRRHTKPMKQFLGARPPSELISQELTTYFPDHKKDEIEKTVTLSQRRSARLSRAMSRLSIASNLSVASSLKDAPPMPSIADQWLNQLPSTNSNSSVNSQSTQSGRPSRPLSVSRFPGSWRDSIISTSLQPLQEESPTEPNRKSYVSFDSASDHAAINVTDPNGVSTNFSDDGPGSGANTDPNNSMNEHYRSAIAEDGEDADVELDEFLKDDSWDNVKWMQGALIGQGSFGSVFLALHSVTGELMAVKQVDMPSKASNETDKRKESMVAALRREIDLLRTLNHPHIVQYLGSNSKEDKFNIFLEYVPGGSVAAMLNSYGKLKEPLIRNFVRQILDGLAYLHSKDIIHRDIKGANVLVDNRGNIKISDFGISKRVEVSNLGNPTKHNNRTSLQGSVFWMAPEVVKQISYTRKADIWSLGCLIVEMFTGEHPFPNCNQLQAIFQIGQKAKPAIPEDASEEAKAFLERTFEHDYEKRPSAEDLLQEPFLKKRVE
ncbi:ATP binding [Thelotrema lepadinum]|nr:ATP binding [Thelotrema lepadinum]